MLINFTNIRKKYEMDIRGVIHIGAHHGKEIQEYLDNGIQNITVFEPVSETFDILAKKLEDYNADINGYQVALGNRVGTATMNLSPTHSMSSSLLKPKQHLELHPDVIFDGTEEVAIDMLDNFDLRGANFINMDVQGYELEVLKGGSKSLENIDYVYCEVNRDEVYEGNAFIEEIDEYLSNYGFQRVLTKYLETYYTWGDALYIKGVK
jgi:FkbM family methyltransferase